MIKLVDVTKTFYQKERQIAALTNINLHVPNGEIFGIIGSSGAGKSTLIRCVNLLEHPTSGEIFVDGKSITTLNSSGLNQARRRIGMIFQHFNLLSSRTVYGNIALPLELDNIPRIKRDERVMYLLELVGLMDKKEIYPGNLSGGQKQRVAIARALANNPKILLCDEATSALDPSTTHSILQLLKNINRQLGLTILLITHEMDVVKNICDRVALISEGRIIEQGKVSTIFSHPKTAIAQQFIQSSLHLPVPEDYAQRLMPSLTESAQLPLLHLEFTGKSVDAPLISQAARQFNLDISILSAKMDYAGGIKFGVMLAEILGKHDDAQAAIEFLKDHHVKVEILGYV